MHGDRLAWRLAVPVGVGLLYLLLAGSVDAGEAVACLGVVVLACLHAWGLARSGSVTLRPSGRSLVALARGAAKLLPETFQVGTALLRTVRRRPPMGDDLVAHQPFRFGDDTVRRAATTIALSLAPNGFVVGADPGLSELLLHQLVPDEVGRDAEWPL